MNWVLIAIAVAALICPITMFGPMLLQRLGFRKGGEQAGMSCMGMRSPPRRDATDDVKSLRARRDALDGEIARVQASSHQQGDGDQPRTVRSEPTMHGR